METNKLIEQVKEGKVSKKLYAYFPVVKKWLLANGCSKNDAADIYQQALLVFCQKCRQPNFELTSSIETYLFGVSRFVFYNQKRLQKPEAAELSEVELAASNDVDEHKEKETKLHIAFKALEAISDRCRQLLQLFYLKQISMTDIAKKLGFTSDQSAKTQKYKCLQFAKQKALEFYNQ
ncbi:MAG: sigma-70 family RNA polymerase sigma factor [Flavobacteriales bacterium]|nr:sigma-70 family RNA polymerase sigma factor [Flavobacteriales bacterium]